MPGSGRVAVGLSILLLLASARGAEAANGWLEKLSGPGPFLGWDFPTLPLLCFGEEVDRKLFCKGYQDLGRNSVILSFTFSDYDSERNPLEYGDSSTADTTVNLKSYAFSLDLRLHRAVDVGVGGGVNRFSGEAFRSFTRFSLDALRVTWRPVGLFLEKDAIQLGQGVKLSLRDLLQVKMRATLFPEGFDAADFGASGTFDEPADLLLGYSVSLGVVIWW
jgi:hypothetical protein